MAIAVPFIASTIGASTIASVGIGIAFSVTGISDKINKAASKVFGEDLVNFANIAGAGFAMWNGGFDIGGGAAEAAGGEILTASTPELTAEAWNAAGADNLAVINEAAGVTDGLTGASQSTFNLDTLSRMPELGDDGLSMLSSDTAPTPIAGKNLLDPAAQLNTDSKLANANSGYEAMPPTDVGATSQTPTSQASTQQAAASVRPTATTSSATKAVAPTATTPQATTPQAPAVTPTESGSNNFSKLVDKLLYNKSGELNERLIGGVLQGGGAVAASYLQRSAQQKAAKEAQDRRDAMAPGRFY